MHGPRPFWLASFRPRRMAPGFDGPIAYPTIERRGRQHMAINEEKLHAFLNRAVGDLGAAMSAVLMTIGDELGYYKALAKEALTPADLARLTLTSERYTREWLGNQAAGGYVDYNPETQKYRLNDEQS